MDKRKTYYLTIDTETANSLEDALVYDIGGAIHDKNGNVYETFSFVVAEIFFDMADIMNSAYYSEKLPQYYADIKNGTRKVARWLTIKNHIANLCSKYNVKAIIAYNMRFDYKSTATTQRYLTKSKNRYFFPKSVELWDSLKMVDDTIAKQKLYVDFCKTNGLLQKNGKPNRKAETVYRYLTSNPNYIEEHTGLADVLIETQIFAKCMRQHKKMRKLAFS